MKTTLYYYSGTGNSLWIARQLAERLGNAELTAMTASTAPVPAGRIGLVFPVHIWGVPHRVLHFVQHLAVDPSQYFFALAVNAGQVAATLLQLKKVLKTKGLTLAAGFDFEMPSNYIPWGGAEPVGEQQRLFGLAKEKLERIAGIIKNQATGPVEKGPLWQNLLYSGLMYKMSYPYISKMDKNFWVDDPCNHCAICAKICPAQNIVMTEGKPAWQHRCEQCLACLQWCPQQAIQYGKKTPGYERYHHPEVKLADMMLRTGK